MIIEGIPEGWELVRIGNPIVNVDLVIGSGGLPELFNWTTDSHNWPIIRKIEKPKKFRPFANAAEFEPFRDRWVKRSDKADTHETMPAVCFRVSAYSDRHFWIGDGVGTSYEDAFEDGKCFDDGTPFGIEVTE